MRGEGEYLREVRRGNGRWEDGGGGIERERGGN